MVIINLENNKNKGAKAAKRKKIKKPKTLQNQQKAVIMFTENPAVLLLHQYRKSARKPALPESSHPSS